MRGERRRWTGVSRMHLDLPLTRTNKTSWSRRVGHVVLPRMTASGRVRARVLAEVCGLKVPDGHGEQGVARERSLAGGAAEARMR